MNTKLIESLAQIIESLTSEEQAFLEQTVNSKHLRSHSIAEASQKSHFYETATSEEWINALRQWSKSHRRDTPLLSDEAVSRQAIYEEN